MEESQNLCSVPQAKRHAITSTKANDIVQCWKGLDHRPGAFRCIGDWQQKPTGLSEVPRQRLNRDAVSYQPVFLTASASIA